jgi:hypothetical protein
MVFLIDPNDMLTGKPCKKLCPTLCLPVCGVKPMYGIGP